MPEFSTDRRRFLTTSALATSAALLPAPILALSRRAAQGYWPQAVSGYGPLAATTDQATGADLLMLPEGFSYRTFHWTGETLSDGRTIPDGHDGMGVVAAEGDRMTLVRNHERRGPGGPIGDPGQAYDHVGGGTSSFHFNSATGETGDSWISLSGTLHNCSGGVTPWGTWLSCEEGPFTPALAREHRPDVVEAWDLQNLKRRHGWVFEVPAEGVAKPEPIRAMGQFFHEAAEVDPETGIVYMTEDRFPAAGLYRFMPNQPGQLHEGGQLQALRVPERPDWRQGGELHRPYAAEWVDIEKPEQGQTPGTHDFGGVMAQAVAAGATQFVALEGMCLQDDQVIFTSKAGGQGQCGQIFAYDTRRQIVRLLLDAPSERVLNGPDNLTTSPGGEILVCEDPVKDTGQAASLMMLDEQGDYFYLAQINNRVTGEAKGHDLAATVADSEWCGASFSPDGRWLLVNLQSPGVTLAITGPWDWATS